MDDALAGRLQALDDAGIAGGGYASLTLPVHRLAIARDLVRRGQAARAEYYLQWPDAVLTGARSSAVSVLFGPLVSYERALAAEAAGNRSRAIVNFQLFLGMTDAPDPALRPLVENARARLARLTGDTRK